MRRLVLMLPLALACKPNLGSPPSIVEGPRILAVRGLPAEAAENTPVTYDVLAVDETGRIATPTIGWYQCDKRKPPADGNAVAAACLDPMDETTGPTFTGDMPDGACKRFGPQPDVDEKMNPIRPRDPDVTGGFYQPVRATLTTSAGDATAFALERIKCRLTGASPEATGLFNDMYKVNDNPTITSLVLDPDNDPVTLFARAPQAPAPAAPTTPVISVGANGGSTLALSWSADSAEAFPVWNVEKQQLDPHHEAISVSWYATAGSFDHDRTGVSETDFATVTTANRWVSPTVVEKTQVHLWVVVRDSRGGVDFAETLVEVVP